MICEFCHCVYCWDDAGEVTTGRPDDRARRRFCSPECRDAAREERRRRKFPNPCPTPQKRALSSVKQARWWAGQLPGAAYPYPCEAGGHWHVTSDPRAGRQFGYRSWREMERARAGGGNA